LGGIVFGLIESSRLGFHSLIVIATLIGGVILAAIFVLVEAKLRHPMLPLSLFRTRNFTGANLLTLFLYAALAGTLFFLPLNLIQVQRYSATAAALRLCRFILIMFGPVTLVWRISEAVRITSPAVIGPVIAGIGFALFRDLAPAAVIGRAFFPQSSSWVWEWRSAWLR